MTRFQKLLIPVLIAFVVSLYFSISLYLDKQRQISDCKYLISNEKNIFQTQEEHLKLLLPPTKNSSDWKEQEIERIWNEEWEKYSNAKDEYRQSADNCLKILRNLGNEK